MVDITEATELMDKEKRERIIQTTQKIIVNLDGAKNLAEIESIVNNLFLFTGFFSISLNTTALFGGINKVVDSIHKNRGRVLLNVGLATSTEIFRISEIAANLGVYLISIDALSSAKTLKTAVAAVKFAKKTNACQTLVFSNLSLPPGNAEDFFNLFVATFQSESWLQYLDKVKENYIPHIFFHLYRISKFTGVDGIISSPQNLKKIKEEEYNDVKFNHLQKIAFCLPSDKEKEIETDECTCFYLNKKIPLAVEVGANSFIIGDYITNPLPGIKSREEAIVKVAEEIINFTPPSERRITPYDSQFSSSQGRPFMKRHR